MRMLIQIGAEIGCALTADFIEPGANRAVVFDPQRDRRVLIDVVKIQIMVDHWFQKIAA